MLRLIATVLVVGIVYSAARPGSSTPAPGCVVTTPSSQPSGPYVGRPCPCSKDKIWLDIIIAIDNSASMGVNGLTQVKATLSTVFGTLTIGQGLRQQTRVALISYAKSAKIIGNLTTYKDPSTFSQDLFTIPSTNDMQVNLYDALNKAEIVRAGVDAKARQTVYVIAASAYNGEGKTDPAPHAKQIRESGAKILTYAFVRTGEGPDEVEKISSLASPGYAFTSDQGNAAQLAPRIEEKFCDANCFCPNGWTQLSDDFRNPTETFAECLYLSSTPSNWFSASMACPLLLDGASAFLASEFTAGKHKFNMDYVANTTGTVQPYFIGLSWDAASGRYLWSEKYPNGTQIPLDPKGYQPWAKGSGNHVLSGVDGVQVKKIGFLAYWNDINKFGVSGNYMCQVNACDTDNYCDDSIDDD